MGRQKDSHRPFPIRLLIPRMGQNSRRKAAFILSGVILSANVPGSRSYWPATRKRPGPSRGVGETVQGVGRRGGMPALWLRAAW